MNAFRLASATTALTTMSAGGLPKNDIEPNQLAELIKKGVDIAFGRLVIVDCRRFLDYNMSHIKNAINVCCSKLIRKRLQENKMSILDILRPDSIAALNDGSDVVQFGVSFEAQSAVDNEPISECCPKQLDVILYADNGGMVSPSNSRPTRCGSRKCPDDVPFVAMLMEKLSSTPQFQSVRMLKGGFVDFQARFPELCEGAAGGLGSMGSPAGGRIGGLGVASKLTLTSLSQPCLPVSNQGPTKILPFLYLGSQQDAMDQDTLSKYGIDYVLNMSVGCPKPDFVQDEHFMRIAVNDSNSEKLLPYFERAFEFLDKVKEANSCVLVHCLAGISRSPTLAIAFVMRHLHMSSEEAYRYVKEKRPAISPNFNFLGQLLEFEKQLKTLRQQELQQHHGFNSITPTPKPSSTAALCAVAAGSKTAATTPDFAGAAKPLLFLNLQNTNCPAKIPVTQCSSNRDIGTTIETSSMKRSSSCPVKIQKSGLGNTTTTTGPLRDALNLDFEFSPATRTNANGKRQMMPSESNMDPSTICPEVKEDPADDSINRYCSDETQKLRSIFKQLDKAQTEKFLGSDFFTARAPSPKMHFGVKVLKPLHEELPSPSTELSKLNFDGCGGAVLKVSDMDVSEKQCPPSTRSMNASSVSSSWQSWCPSTVQISGEYSSSSSRTTTGFVSSFPKLPFTSSGFEHRRSSSGATVSSASTTYSTCVTNPFFSSSKSVGGCDFQRNLSQFGMTRMRTDEIPEVPEPMAIVEETAEDSESSAAKTFSGECQLETKMDSQLMTTEYRAMGSTIICCSSKDLTVIRSSGRALSADCEPIGGSTSAENPLFHSSQHGSAKRQQSNRRASVSEKSEDQLKCPLTAPVVLPSSKAKAPRIQLMRSDSQLALVSSTRHLASMREKLASARSLIFSSFSERMRHFINKRASWPHVVPYFAGLAASESEASALWALAPKRHKEERRATGISTDQQTDFTKEQATPLKSEPFGFYSSPISSVIDDASSVATSSTSEARLSSATDSSLLAPPFDIDSPESGFAESPTALLHQKESTPSSTASGHVAPQTAPGMFLHRDPERDSLGSTSSLEIAVS